MSLCDAYDKGYREGFRHDPPNARHLTGALRDLYAVGYREGSEDAEFIGEGREAFV